MKNFSQIFCISFYELKLLKYSLFILLFLFIQCNNNSKQEIKKPEHATGSAKPKTENPKQEALKNNPDIIKPPTPILLNNCPKTRVITVPKTGVSSYTIQTESGPRKIELKPPAITTLSAVAPEAQGIGFFTTYNTEQGLALSSILSGCIDHLGNLWFGTDGGGVSRYDGKKFTNFTTTQGLANNVVNSIFEDKNGNLWFGTNGGVSRYDGKSFTTFTTEDGLAGINYVVSIVEDKTGNIWVGTWLGGLSRFDSNKKGTGGKSFTPFGIAIGGMLISTITDKTGNLWFGNKLYGVSRFDPSANHKESVHPVTTFTTAQGLANNGVRSILEDKTGNLWFGTDGGGVSRYDGKSFTNFTTVHGLTNNYVRCITEDKIGNLWFGTNGGGVSRFDGKSFTTFTTAQGLANNEVRIILEDKTGNLWFGTYGGGISRYDGKSFTRFSTEQGLAKNIVLNILEDKNGNLWFGTKGAGVSCYDGKSFATFTTAQGLSGSWVKSILEDKAGNLWLGIYSGGVCRYDGKSFTVFTEAQGISSFVFYIFEDSAGNLWFTTDGGVVRFDGKSSARFTTAQGLANNGVSSILEDKTGNLWFGTEGGVSRCAYPNKGGNYSFTNFTTAHGLGNNEVITIIEDKTGNLWFGTAGGGISFLNDSSRMCGMNHLRFKTFTTADGLSDDVVTSIVEDMEGRIFLGTNKGISVITGWRKKYNSNSVSNSYPSSLISDSIPVFEIYHERTGYPVKNINSMCPDNKGIIWVATGDDKTALVRFDYKAVQRNPNPPTVVIQNIRINEENISWYALRSPKTQAQNSKTQDSALEFGTWRLDLVSSSEDSLAIINEEVFTFGKPLTPAERNTLCQKFRDIQFDGITSFYPIPENLILPYKHNNITFEFAAIEPARPYLIKYQYILEGYDKDWRPITDKTSASFGNIWEGTYTFKIRALFTGPAGRDAINGVSGDQWSEPVIYRFSVLPPWYRTWWMYVIYVVVFISILYLVYRWRIAKLQREKQILEDKVIIRTKELTEANIELDKLSLVARKTDNYVIITDKDDRIEYVNEGFTRITGFSLDDVKGRLPSVVLRGTGTDRETAGMIDEKAKNKEPFTAEIINFTKKGGKVWLYLNVTPVLDENGEVIRRITVGSDITERKNAEEKIRQQNIELEKLSIVASETDNAIVIMDGSGNFEWANKSFEKLYGITQEEYIDKHGRNLLNASSSSKIKNIVSKCIETGQSDIYDSSFIHPEGKTIYFQTTLTPILNREGKVIKLITIDSDITEIKKAEKKIKQQSEEITAQRDVAINQKNELGKTLDELRRMQKQLVESEKMASLGGLVAGVAHEINTPVGIGITAASTLSDITRQLNVLYKQGKMTQSCFDDYLENAVASSDLILSNLQRTGELIKSFKQVSVDQVTEQKREFNFGSYVQDIVRSLHPKLKHTKLNVEVDCKNDIIMNSFPGPFAQIITNLIINSSIHGFPDNDEGLLRLEATTDNKNLTFIYSDNGKGMAPEVFKKVFDPFFTTDKQRGTGLGMHIVYNLVTHKLKGDIKAWSEPGKGVRFTIVVPLTV
ncbi:MAG: PAS domain S-box protein [Bacteroidia bacterium]|nr:PAS domain S-box protein [Bacteroidia bacterium]